MNRKKGDFLSRTKYIVHRMAEIRKQKKMSLRTLAGLLNVAPSTVQKMESFSTKYLDINFVYKFCDKMEISIETLMFDGTEEEAIILFKNYEDDKKKLLNLSSYQKATKKKKNFEG